MGDEIRVTVVATGMGAKAVVNTPVKLVQKAAAGDVDYGVLDKPTVLRQTKQETRETRFGAQPKNDMDLDYLDVPAFLRRQAD